MIFKKKTPQQDISLVPSKTESEEAELKSLEAELEFLKKPGEKKEDKSSEPPTARFGPKKEESAAQPPLQLVPANEMPASQAQQNPTGGIALNKTVSGMGNPVGGVAPQPMGNGVNPSANANPVGVNNTAVKGGNATAGTNPAQRTPVVAQAVTPPSIIHNQQVLATAPHMDSNREKKNGNAPAEAEKPAAPSQVRWGRQMNYRTAVVKSGGHSNTIEYMPNHPQTMNGHNASQPTQGNTGTSVPQPNLTAPANGQAQPIPAKTANGQMQPIHAVPMNGQVQPVRTVPNGSVQPIHAVPVNAQVQPITVSPANGQAQTASTATAQIPNPLPVPKKHVSKQMDFDIQPTASDMHFDLVDMSGKDFFDIN